MEQQLKKRLHAIESKDAARAAQIDAVGEHFASIQMALTNLSLRLERETARTAVQVDAANAAVRATSATLTERHAADMRRTMLQFRDVEASLSRLDRHIKGASVFTFPTTPP